MDDTSRQRIMRYLADKHRDGVEEVTIAEIATYAYPGERSTSWSSGRNNAGPAVSRILSATGAATRVKKSIWKIDPSRIDPVQMTLPGT